MKKMLIYCALLVVSALAQAADSTIKLSGIEGWKTIDVKTDKAFSAIFEGSEQILLVDKNSTVAPVVRVRTLSETPSSPLNSVTAWNKFIFKTKSPTLEIITSQKILKSGYYLVAFQTDVGTQNMLHSVLLAANLGGKIRILIYEQRRDAYLESLPLVSQLFQNVKISVETKD